MKKYSVKEISFNKECDCNKNIFTVKKDKYVFFTTRKFNFLEVKKHTALGLSCDTWCKAMGSKLQKLMFS